jgi:hypothetical protein
VDEQRVFHNDWLWFRFGTSRRITYGFTTMTCGDRAFQHLGKVFPERQNGQTVNSDGPVYRKKKRGLASKS